MFVTYNLVFFFFCFFFSSRRRHTRFDCDWSSDVCSSDLTRRRWTAEPIVIPRTATLAEACAATRRFLPRCSPDVVFIALHGAFGEDGTVQELCDELHLPYTGSSAEVSRLGMDKVASRKQFEAAGLTVPRWWTVDPEEGQARYRPWPYPIVVKPTAQGSSVGISIVRRP